MDLVIERSSVEQTTTDQATGVGLTPTEAGRVSSGRPWGPPGPDAKWWHGVTEEHPELPPTRRPTPAHRERPAETTRTVEPAKVSTPPVSNPPVSNPPVSNPPVEAQKATAPEAPWPAPQMLAGRPPRPVEAKPRKVRRSRTTRRPVVGLVALVVLGLLGIFFAWVSAEPAWLSVGHGARGTATVATCHVHGIPKRCADFVADGGGYEAAAVTLLGTGPVADGQKVRARMVGATGSAAYAGSVRVRLGLGLLGVLLCGFGIAWLTGAYRLGSRRARRWAFLLSLAGPALVTAGMLAATW
jgi:hypothetical protein